MFKKSLKTAVVILFIPAFAYANENNHQHKNEHDHHQHEEQEHHKHSDNKIEKIQVRASRLGRIVTESATRTEIISEEEIQKKALMRPVNLSMLVSETVGG